MSETVIIALITAGTGIAGAALGAIAAVLGPWWLRRDDRKAENDRASKERRRVAVVAWSNAQIRLFDAGISVDEYSARATVSNATTAELTSLLTAAEKPIVTWIHGTVAMTSLLPGEEAARGMFGYAAQRLLAWHRGDSDAQELRPIQVWTTGLTLDKVEDADDWDVHRR